MAGWHLLLAAVLTVLFVESVLAFDVRNHLSSTTRYSFRHNGGRGQDVVPTPPGCTPFHINLVARHGTRSPTKKRMRELDQLEGWIKEQAEVATLDTVSACKLHNWLHKWESPWKGRKLGGELVTVGEEEMYALGGRLRTRFPQIFSADYHPEIFRLFATQVPRASASAVAFGLGLFSGAGTLGSGRQRAFAVISESRANDTRLRFHESCQAYKGLKRAQKPVVESLQDQIYSHVASSLLPRVHLNLSGSVVASLWLLCKQEAAVLDITHQACSLFTPEQVELLEFADDVELHYLKGYGQPINYLMAIPLLQDVLQSMEDAITAFKASNFCFQSVQERARLRFAHAETLIPFTCLLGLFQTEDTDLSKVYDEVPNEVSCDTCQGRVWRGSNLAPFGANTALVLFKCGGDQSSGSDENVSLNFLVQALHNEEPVLLPGCDSVFCPFHAFKERIVGQHLIHQNEDLCSTRKQLHVYQAMNDIFKTLWWPWL